MPGQLLRLSRGRVKPYNSLPRIDWTHPLTIGLATYCYDIDGQIIDLVHNTLSTQVTCSGSQQAQFGRGLKIPLTGFAFMPALPASLINPLGGAVPYSAAMGTFYTGAPATGVQPDGAIASIQDSNSATENTVFGFNAWSNGSPGNPNPFDAVTCVLNNADNAFFAQAITPGTFQSWGFAATGSSAGTLYAAGKFDSNTAFPTTFAGVTQPQVIFNSARATTQDFGNACNGFVPYYAGWGRVLSPLEFLTLHQDPYCFLIYPEDEMMNILVGTTAALGSFLPSLPLTGVG